MDEQEQNDKIEELETSLEELTDVIKGLLEEQPEESEQEFFEAKYDSKSFIIHWVEDSEHSTIDNYGDAKAEFLAAALARDNTEDKTPVQHGDVMVIGTNCPWIALCVVVDSFDQREDPHAPEVAASDETTIGNETVVRREFVVWNACGDPTIGDPCIPNGVETEVSVVGSVSYTPPPAGSGEKTHTIIVSQKTLFFDSCGSFLRWEQDSEDNQTITIKECCEEEEPEPSNCPDHNDTYVFTPVGGAPVTLTRFPDSPSGGCSKWFGDTNVNTNAGYILEHFGGGQWQIAGTIPIVTCPGAQVDLFDKMGGNANTPLGQYSCAGDPLTSVGEIS